MADGDGSKNTCKTRWILRCSSRNAGQPSDGISVAQSANTNARMGRNRLQSMVAYDRQITFPTTTDDAHRVSREPQSPLVPTPTPANENAHNVDAALRDDALRDPASDASRLGRSSFRRACCRLGAARIASRLGLQRVKGQRSADGMEPLAAE